MIEFTPNPNCQKSLPEALEEEISENIRMNKIIATSVPRSALKFYCRLEQAKLFRSQRKKGLPDMDDAQLATYYDSLFNHVIENNRNGFFYKLGSAKGSLKLPLPPASLGLPDLLNIKDASSLAQTCKKAAKYAKEGLEKDWNECVSGANKHR